MNQVPDAAQHFIVCDTESCKNVSKFYCNTCHQRICDDCKQPHLFQNIGHQIVPYQERKRKFPSEKCRINPTKDINIYCNLCQDPFAGKLNKEEIVKKFGEIEFNLSERFEVSSVSKVSEVTIQGHKIFHLSTLSPNKFWASDGTGNLLQSDMEGNILQRITTKLWNIRGNHTVTTGGELLYTDYHIIVHRVTSKKSNKLITTKSWGPGAIFSSPINGHILVGMERKTKKKITRYNREGRKLQEIQWDNQGQSLYQRIDYITENINGDICTSDSSAGRVVVVTASGEYRFFYSGLHSRSRFCPFGICTDVLGQILVCNYSNVHLLDINGQFLSVLLTRDQCPKSPCGLCIDDQHNLWIGGLDSSTVSVYKYLENYHETISYLWH